MERIFIFSIVLGIVAALILLLLNYLIFSGLPEFRLIFSFINIFAALMMVLPLLVYQISVYTRKKHIEEYFPIFLRDFVEASRGGLTLPQALKSVSKNDYKELTPFIKKLSVRLEWGIPIDEALQTFAKETKSKMISRIVASVIEAQKFGGNIVDTFQSLTNVAIEIDRLRKERMAYLQGQIATGYIIFFVFLGVIIAIEKFLLPGLDVSVSGITDVEKQTTQAAELSPFFKNVFRDIIIIQGIFAGLAVGKMSEGSVIAGIKHSFFMVFVGILIFTIFS
ncbi:MAG: type II secretion system F family protein [Candidatus Aenigmarchaeota archaeon]|nr:type II secretion system F family protein [Candidatus Aenigmarchaeota archaeon]MDW8159822.1 type II secretion system F family protein [Candidatus Aenigmarchaeota archaeon]